MNLWGKIKSENFTTVNGKIYVKFREQLKFSRIYGGYNLNTLKTIYIYMYLYGSKQCIF